MTKEVKELIREAKAAGWKVTLTRNSHLKFVSPDGHVLHSGGTPGDWRAQRNLRAQLRRPRPATPRHPPRTPAKAKAKHHSTNESVRG
jgi:hypothetical protein